MSLQSLNQEFQLELIQTKKQKPHAHGAFNKLRLDNFGGLFRRDFPDTRRLEELLVGFD